MEKAALPHAHAAVEVFPHSAFLSTASSFMQPCLDGNVLPTFLPNTDGFITNYKIRKPQGYALHTSNIFSLAYDRFQFATYPCFYMPRSYRNIHWVTNCFPIIPLGEENLQHWKCILAHLCAFLLFVCLFGFWK